MAVSVLDTYYQVVEKETEAVSATWKVCHLILFIVGGISGFASAYSFSKLLQIFDGNCILNANLVFLNLTNEPLTNNSTENTPHELLPIDTDNTEWPKEVWCNYCEYTFLVAFIYCFFWSVFFAMCPNGGAGRSTDILEHPWKIIYPSLVFTFIYSIVLIISTVQLRKGLKNFCDEFTSTLNITKCSAEIDVYSLTYMTSIHPVYLTMEISTMSAYICCSCWIIQFIVLLLRLLTAADFSILKIIIYEKMNGNQEKETEQNISETEPTRSLLESKV